MLVDRCCRFCSEYKNLHTCGACLLHCGCRVCPYCKRKRPAHICNFCEKPKCQCQNACRGTGNLARPRLVGAPTFTQIPLLRTLGVEIEVANVSNVHRALDIPYPPTLVRDGSISGGENPQEIVTQPLVGDQIIENLSDITSWIRNNRGFVNASCGLHVHVGGRWAGAGYDFDDIYALRRLLLLYTRFEKTFFSWVARSRRSGGYSKPLTATQRVEISALPYCKDSASIKAQIIKIIYAGNESAYLGRDFSGVKTHKYSHGRYCALNLHSWFYRKTIEFRHHEGTLALQEILGWALWCAYFVELASRLNDSEAEKIHTVRQLINARVERSFTPIWTCPHPSRVHPEYFDLRRWALAHLRSRKPPAEPEPVDPDVEPIEESGEEEEEF